MSTSAIESEFGQLEDLFVKPETRGLGVGKALFGELGKIAQEKVNHHHPTIGIRL